MQNCRILIQDSEKSEYVNGHRIYDGAGLRALLLDAGFESVRVCGGLIGQPYDIDARWLVVAATKAAR